MKKDLLRNPEKTLLAYLINALGNSPPRNTGHGMNKISQKNIFLATN
jgi:hypothetical protein